MGASFGLAVLFPGSAAAASGAPVRYALSELQMENTKQARSVAAMRREIDYLLTRLNEIPSDILPARPVQNLAHGAGRTTTSQGSTPPPAQRDSNLRTHAVRPGETLSSIARRHGVHFKELQRVNGISDPSKLQPGTVLTIPSAERRDQPSFQAPSAQGSAAGTSSATYVVRKGETFWSIARNRGITVAELLRANGLTEGAVLREGQRLRLPASLPPGTGRSTRSQPPGASSSTGYVYYTARPGDSFESIAAQRGISVAQLRSDNPPLSSEPILRAGEVLVVPELGYRGGSPTVSKMEPSSTNPGQWGR